MPLAGNERMEVGETTMRRWPSMWRPVMGSLPVAVRRLVLGSDKGGTVEERAEERVWSRWRRSITDPSAKPMAR